MEEHISELKGMLGYDKKLLFCDLDKLVQEWNEIIYLIKREKSLENHFFKLIVCSVLAKKFYYEKIGRINYAIDKVLHFYEIKDIGEIVLVTNNNLLLKTELQGKRYVDMAIEHIRKIVSNKKTRKRKTIPKKVKDDLWILYFGEDNAKGKCYICKTEIHISKFEAGHVTSDSNGGEPIIENLRPICGPCNKSMGEENLYLYKNKYYPKK